MTILPIVERELRWRARRKSTHWYRFAAALVACGIGATLLFLLQEASTPTNLGAGVFHLMAGLAFVYCVLDGARHTVDCLSQEKREGTLGLLFLTDLKGYDVVLGKFSAASLNSFYGLLAVFPPLAVPLVLGGVMAGEFWRCVLALINVLFFTLASSLLVSTLSRSERKAWGAATSFVAVFCLLLPVAPLVLRAPGIPGWLAPLSRAAPTLEHWALGSPTTVFVQSFDAAYKANADRYWTGLLLTHLFSWLMLAVASWWLPRSWQASVAGREGFLRRWWPARFAFVQRQSRPLLNANPIVWMASYHAGGQWLLWTVIGVAGLGSIGGSLLAYGSEFVRLLLLTGGLVLHFALSGRAAVQGCYRFAGARDSGLLELLLVTPLSARDIIRGHLQAQRRLFFWPVVCLVGCEFLALIIQLISMHRGNNPLLFVLVGLGVAALILLVLLLDLYAVSVFGMWQGLIQKKPSEALARTLLMVLILPHVVGLCFGLLWPLMGVVKNLLFIHYARGQLLHQFHDTVAERYAEGAFDRPRPGTAAPKRS